MIIKVAEKHDGILLRTFLRGVLGFSGRSLTDLKKREDGIVLNGERVTVRAFVHAGDTLSLGIEDAGTGQNPKYRPIALPLEIVYEDENIICVNKGAGMPTHPTHGHREDTLANALAYYFEKSDMQFVFRPVNRLDADTSGIVIAAKNKAACDYVAAQLRSRTAEKKYYAVLDGHAPQSCVIEGYIRRDGESIITRSLHESGSADEYSCTSYRVLEYIADKTLVEARPHTGRTHQLRVHFSSIGHPICSDTLYGSPDPDMPRQALEAYAVAFNLPFSGRRLSLDVPLSPDIKKFLEAVYERKKTV